MRDIGIAGKFPQSLQLQLRVSYPRLRWCHTSGEWEKNCACASVCFCIQSGGGATIRLFTYHLQSCDRGGRVVTTVRLTLKGVMQNDRGPVDVILPYIHTHTHTHIQARMQTIPTVLRLGSLTCIIKPASLNNESSYEWLMKPGWTVLAR